jgi:TolA-binding protein
MIALRRPSPTFIVGRLFAAFASLAVARLGAATSPAHAEHPVAPPEAVHDAPAHAATSGSAHSAPGNEGEAKAPAHAEPRPAGPTHEATPSGETAPGHAAESKEKHSDPHETPKAAKGSAATAEPPDEIKGMLKIGFNSVERRAYDAAEIAFRQVIAAPRAPVGEIKTALYALAQMHRRKGEFTKAAAIYERYLKDYAGDERTPDVLLELGRTLRSLGAYKLAITRFYNVLNSTLKLPGEGFDRYQQLAKTAQFEIAETHFQSGEFAEANKFYTRLRLLDLAPVDRARAHFKAGYALRLQGSLEPAVTTLRSYLEQWPDDDNVPEARYLLALTLRELKRPQDAFNATLELLQTEKSRVEIDPKRWAYWQRKTGNQLANDFYESGAIANARAIYTGLLDLAKEPVWRLPIIYQIGLCDERLGAIDRARIQYQTVVEAIGATPAPEFAELATMAKWRIQHMEWRDRVTQQISSHFDGKGDKSAAITPPAAPTIKTAATP